MATQSLNLKRMEVKMSDTAKITITLNNGKEITLNDRDSLAEVDPKKRVHVSF